MLFRSDEESYKKYDGDNDEDDQADDEEEQGDDEWDEGEKYTMDEKLGKSDEAGKWIHDFVHSKNPKFHGKSPEQRKKMALGAYYAAQRAEATDYTNVQKTMKSLQDAYVAMQQPVNEAVKKPDDVSSEYISTDDSEHAANVYRDKAYQAHVKKHFGARVSSHDDSMGSYVRYHGPQDNVKKALLHHSSQEPELKGDDGKVSHEDMTYDAHRTHPHIFAGDIAHAASAKAAGSKDPEIGRAHV